MKIKRRARTEHALNEAFASCFVVILIRRIKSHYVVVRFLDMDLLSGSAGVGMDLDSWIYLIHWF
ncbi:hypothetical protein Hanom_Chr10g00891581 [Helianthus anomalus]